MLIEQHQLAGGLILQLQCPQTLPMLAPQLTEQIGVGGIALGPAGCHRLTKVRQTTRIDRIEFQERILQQRIQQRSARLFQHHADMSGEVLLLQLQKELIQLLWLLIHPVQLGVRTVGPARRDAMLLICPIDSDPQDSVFGGGFPLRNVLLFGAVAHSFERSRKLWTSEGLIASRRDSRPLRIR